MSRFSSEPSKSAGVRSLLSPVHLKSTAALLLGACSSKANPNYDLGADGGFDGFPDREIHDAGADAGADAGTDAGSNGE